MFMLRIPLTPSAVEQIKRNLTKSFAHVKSSHRVEAFGRGVGFRTYAALLSASRSPEPTIGTVSGSAFVSYLKDHGIEAEPAHFYRAVANVAIRSVLDAMPRLSIHGIGFGRPQRNQDGSRQTPEQQFSEFTERRNECLDAGAAQAFLLSLALLTRIKPTKTIRSGTGSYRLKHVAENYECFYPEGSKLGPHYVPNGMLIAAAVHMGFSCKTHVDDLGYDTPNVTFNMSKASIDDLDAEIRPRTGFAQDRMRTRHWREAKEQLATIKRSLSQGGAWPEINRHSPK